jgi:hypothetical protein
MSYTVRPYLKKKRMISSREMIFRVKQHLRSTQRRDKPEAQDEDKDSEESPK